MDVSQLRYYNTKNIPNEIDKFRNKKNIFQLYNQLVMLRPTINKKDLCDLFIYCLNKWKPMKLYMDIYEPKNDFRDYLNIRFLEYVQSFILNKRLNNHTIVSDNQDLDIYMKPNLQYKPIFKITRPNMRMSNEDQNMNNYNNNKCIKYKPYNNILYN